jgi:hypothetical protein
MKKWITYLLLAGSLPLLAGCSRGALAGAAGGVLGAGAGYEYNAKRQIDELDSQLKNGTIDQREYDIRKNQIQKGSLTQ